MAKVQQIVDDVLASQNAFPMTFGELDVFTTRGKRTHVIYLRPTESNTEGGKGTGRLDPKSGSIAPVPMTLGSVAFRVEIK